MSDNATHEAPPADEVEVEDQPAPPAEEPTAEQPESDTFPREYVEQLRTEAADRRKERDTLATQIESLQRQAVEKFLEKTGVLPAALWSVAELPDLVAEDGTVDPAKIDAAIKTARDTLGIPVIGKGNIVPGLGGMPSTPPNVDRWSDAFAPKRR